MSSRTMSPALERLIGRALTDKSFRAQLLADPEVVIASEGLALSTDEINRIKERRGEFTPDKFDQVLASSFW